MLQIEEHKNKSAKNLSGGTLRKVSVANHLQPISSVVLLHFRWNQTSCLHTI